MRIIHMILIRIIRPGTRKKEENNDYAVVGYSNSGDHVHSM